MHKPVISKEQMAIYEQLKTLHRPVRLICLKTMTWANSSIPQTAYMLAHMLRDRGDEHA